MQLLAHTETLTQRLLNPILQAAVSPDHPFDLAQRTKMIMRLLDVSMLLCTRLNRPLAQEHLMPLVQTFFFYFNCTPRAGSAELTTTPSADADAAKEETAKTADIVVDGQPAAGEGANGEEPNGTSKREDSSSVKDGESPSGAAAESESETDVVAFLQDLLTPTIASYAYQHFCQLIGQETLRRNLPNIQLIEELMYEREHDVRSLPVLFSTFSDESMPATSGGTGGPPMASGSSSFGQPMTAAGSATTTGVVQSASVGAEASTTSVPLPTQNAAQATTARGAADTNSTSAASSSLVTGQSADSFSAALESLENASASRNFSIDTFTFPSQDEGSSTLEGGSTAPDVTLEYEQVDVSESNRSLDDTLSAKTANAYKAWAQGWIAYWRRSYEATPAQLHPDFTYENRLLQVRAFVIAFRGFFKAKSPLVVLFFCKVFTGHTAAIWDIVVLENDLQFLTASKDKTVRLWNVTHLGRSSTWTHGIGGGMCRHVYSGHRRPVTSLAYLPHNNQVSVVDLWYLGKKGKPKIDEISKLFVLTLLPYLFRRPGGIL